MSHSVEVHHPALNLYCSSVQQASWGYKMPTWKVSAIRAWSSLLLKDVKISAFSLKMRGVQSKTADVQSKADSRATLVSPDVIGLKLVSTAACHHTLLCALPRMTWARLWSLLAATQRLIWMKFNITPDCGGARCAADHHVGVAEAEAQRLVAGAGESGWHTAHQGQRWWSRTFKGYD